MSPKYKVTKPDPKPAPATAAAPRRRRRPTDTDPMHRRSRNGCYTCRLRRKKCDEGDPVCHACKHLGLECEYRRPGWWQFPERRQKRKEAIKEHVKHTRPAPLPPTKKDTAKGQSQKSSKSSTASITAAAAAAATAAATGPGASSTPSLSLSVPSSETVTEPPAHTRGPSLDSHFSPQFTLDTPRDFFNSTPMIPTSTWTPVHPQFPHFSPFEVDIKTERQMFVNDVPTRKDSTISTFTSYPPPTPTATLPSHYPEGWTHQEHFEMKSESFNEEPLELNFFNYAHETWTPTHQAVIQVEDCDRHLLDHFLENVAPLIFSILDVKQKGSALSDVVLPQLECNRIYLHCCLSTSALHLKITEHIEGDKIDNDIMRHRAATISELCEAFNQDTEHSRMLEATLGMILFQSSVGSPNDGLPDIPWHQHFQAVVSLMDKVQNQSPATAETRPSGHPAFNSTLASWIDILGATMLCRVPIFADSYRGNIEAGTTSGLKELMGCDDRIMYLISEIACLDALREIAKMDDLAVCTHISNLGERLTQTEQGQGEVAPVYSPITGAIRPLQLTKNITAIFRYAARLYLLSLVPDFDRHSSNVTSLVDAMTDVLPLIPSGPEGYDRALVWPLLIAGSITVESSSFRKLFTTRATDLGQIAEFGSFSRVKEVLTEVWRINDENWAKGEKKGIHWREVMKRKGGDYLLI